MSRTVSQLRVPAIAPSILTADFGQLRNQIQGAEAAGVDLIHLDVMDGMFVPNISFGPLVVSAVREATSMPIDVHLMIEQPERYIEAFSGAGADIISVHVEATLHPHRAIQLIRDTGADAGVALNPGTPLVALEELLAGVDLVLLMTVNPGFGGQSFITESLTKVRNAKHMIVARGLDQVRIEVDGGINRNTIGSAHEAGADLFVCGSSVYNDSEPVNDAVSALRAALSN